ncbi:RES family NAD+ phosphorylase [Glycocaulis alkaliphilus]|uniref:RES family NAD+ phosphorylase n=1 Tax=Glycocaulis alkaliphilus TaxID=1434191 RepID=UPI0030040A6B
MNLNHNRVSRFTVDLSGLDTGNRWLRVFKRRHRDDPLGTGHGLSRFSPPPGNRSFKVLYAGLDLETAIAEAVIRDRFEGGVSRDLAESELDRWVVSEIAVRRALPVLDVRGLALQVLNVNTDIAAARNQTLAQQFSAALHAIPSVQGLLYRSRISGVDCIAVYDRAVKSALWASHAINLDRAERLDDALRELEITLVD